MLASNADIGKSSSAEVVVVETEHPSDQVPIPEGIADQNVAIEEPNKTLETGVSDDGNGTAFDKQNVVPTQIVVEKTALKKQSSVLCSSPRMRLSLKKCKVTTPSSARRALDINEREDGEVFEASEFLLGVNSRGNEERDEDSPVESQFQLPAIEVLNDSQFEMSADSQTLFQIQRPTAAEPVVQLPVSSLQAQQQQLYRREMSKK